MLKSYPIAFVVCYFGFKRTKDRRIGTDCSHSVQNSQAAFAHVFLDDNCPAIAAGQETDTNATTNFSQYSDFGRGCFGIDGLAARAGIGWFYTDSASAADGYASPSTADGYANPSTGKTA